MSAECKTWPNRPSALGALNAVKATWVQPAIAWIACREVARTRGLVRVATLVLAVEPFELLNGRWAVVADHPSFKGESVDGADRVLPAVAQPEATVEPAAPKGGK